jgi:uncharacterized membrane protein YkvA (DUF1232 family)
MKWNPRLQKAYDKATDRANVLLKNVPEVMKMLDKAVRKISSLSGGKIKAAVNDLQTLIRMIKAYISGEYKDIPWTTAVSILGAIIYFVSPIDLIPDVIPVFGYIDDAAVVAFVIEACKSDIVGFRVWESSQNQNGPSA